MQHAPVRGAGEKGRCSERCCQVLANQGQALLTETPGEKVCQSQGSSESVSAKDDCWNSQQMVTVR